MNYPPAPASGRGGHFHQHPVFKTVFLIVAGISALLPNQSSAVVIPIGASKDSSLYQDPFGALSNGSGPTFFAGATGGGGIRRGLIEFDLSAIPSGVTIDSVTLDLFLVQAQPFASEVKLHEVLTEWGEGASSAGNRGGGGAIAKANDATWLHTFFNVATWTNPGGDFAAVASASTLVGSEGVTYRWPSTPGLVADVQGWLDAPATNHGWLLHGDESQSGTAKAFGTRENSDIAVRPLLTVTFSPVPEPGAFVSLLGGMGMLLLFRRRV